MKLSYRFTLRHAAILCLTAVLAVSTACNKDETEDEDSTSGTTKVPEFVTYTPEYAEVGVETEAMVLGRNFGTDASKISVTLGDTQMAIREVGKSVIKFTVPATLDIGTYPLRAQVTYADPEGLEQTLASVDVQTSKDFEHIIVDGASTDGSVEIIKKHDDGRVRRIWVSEKDSGIYNAMNKGIRMAHGRYLQYAPGPGGDLQGD